MIRKKAGGADEPASLFAVMYHEERKENRMITLSESLVTIGTSSYYHELADWIFKVFKEVFLSCQDIRHLGSAALDMAYVACGRVDAFFEAILQPWDFSTAKLLIEEAGGKVTDFAGKELPVGMPGAVLAGNGKINEELLRILSEK